MHLLVLSLVLFMFGMYLSIHSRSKVDNNAPHLRIETDDTGLITYPIPQDPQATRIEKRVGFWEFMMRFLNEGGIKGLHKIIIQVNELVKYILRVLFEGKKAIDHDISDDSSIPDLSSSALQPVKPLLTEEQRRAVRVIEELAGIFGSE